MIRVRIKHTDPATGAETIARVTARSIEVAQMMYPGAVIFPLGDDAAGNGFFAPGGSPGVEVLTEGVSADA